MRLSLSPERIIVVSGSSLVIAAVAAVGADTHAIASLFALAFFFAIVAAITRGEHDGHCCEQIRDCICALRDIGIVLWTWNIRCGAWSYSRRFVPNVSTQHLDGIL